MTKKQSIMLALAGATAIAASQAQAQTFTYATGDVLLNFRQATGGQGGTAGANDLTVDIGSANNYIGATSVIPINQFSSANLTTAFGASPFNNLWLSASAVQGLGTDNTLFNTVTRTPGTTANPAVSGSTPFDSLGSSFQGNAAQDINTVGTQATQGSTKNAILASQVVETYDANASSYHGLMGNGGDWSGTFVGGFFSGDQLETTTGTSFTGSSFVRADLYEEGNADNNAPVSYLGYFQFNADGSAFFDPASLVTAVPEPTVYGLLAGLGLLAVALRKQFTLHA